MTYDPKTFGARCDACPLRGRTVVPPELRPDARILIVGQEPGATEEDEGRPFVGPSGRLLHDGLDRIGIRRDQCSVSNVTLCRAPANWPVRDARRREAAECCAPRLDAEVADARAVLMLGAVAYERVTGADARGEAGLSRVRGFPLRLPDGQPALATWHPAFILRSAKFTAVWRRDVAKAFRHASGRLDWPEPRIVLDPNADELRSILGGWNGRLVAVDTETDGLDPERVALRCVGLATADLAVVVGFRSVEAPARTPRCPVEVGRQIVRDFFAASGSGGARLVGHNVNVYDRPVLARHGMPLPAYDRVLDTVVAHHVAESELPHDLNFLSSTLTDSPRHKSDHDHDAWTSDTDLHYYCALDCVVTACVVPFVFDLVVASEQIGVYKVDVLLQRLCVEMRRVGMQIDPGERARHDARLAARMDEAAARVRAVLGREINLASPAQIREALFGAGGYGFDPTSYETEGGEPSTSRDALYELLLRSMPDDARRCVDALLDYRQAEKFRGTFVTALSPGVDGRIHPTWTPHSVVTGRLSCSDPNVQNVPDKRADLDSVRSMYVAAPGRVLVAADMEQLELRLVALIANDGSWLDAFARGLDVHRVNAAVFFDTTYDRVEAYQRTFAKNLTYMFLYRGEAPTAQRNMAKVRDPKTGTRPYARMTLYEAETMREKLLRAHPALERWWEWTVGEWRVAGELRDLRHGRRRLFLEAKYSRDDEVGWREMVNFRIQATAAAFVNDAQAKIADRLPWDVYGPGIIHQGHDSIMVEVEARHVDRAKAVLIESMSTTLTVEGRTLAFPAKAKSGARWSELE